MKVAESRPCVAHRARAHPAARGAHEGRGVAPLLRASVIGHALLPELFALLMKVAVSRPCFARRSSSGLCRYLPRVAGTGAGARLITCVVRHLRWPRHEARRRRHGARRLRHGARCCRGSVRHLVASATLFLELPAFVLVTSPVKSLGLNSSPLRFLVVALSSAGGGSRSPSRCSSRRFGTPPPGDASNQSSRSSSRCSPIGHRPSDLGMELIGIATELAGFAIWSSSAPPRLCHRASPVRPRGRRHGPRRRRHGAHRFRHGAHRLRRSSPIGHRPSDRRGADLGIATLSTRCSLCVASQSSSSRRHQSRTSTPRRCDF